MLSVHDGRRRASGVRSPVMGVVLEMGGGREGRGEEGRVVSQMKLEPRGSCSTSVLY